MKIMISGRGLTGLFLICVWGIKAQTATSQLRYVLSPQSTILVEGTSNKSDWTVTATDFSGWLIVSGTNENARPAVEEFELTVSSAGIVSRKSRIMDKLMYRALKTGQFPEISYRLTSFARIESDSTGGAGDTVCSSAGAGGDPEASGAAAVSAFTEYRSTGLLTLAGVEKEICVDVLARRDADGRIRIAGSYPMKMTDFGIRPPTALFGALHTRDDVIVQFKFIAEQSGSGPADQRP